MTTVPTTTGRMTGDPLSRGRRIASVLLLALGALVVAGSVSAGYGMVAEYGPTNGSLRDGAVAALELGLLPLLLGAAMCAAAYAVARGSRTVRGLAVGVVALALPSLLVAGAAGAQTKLDRLPTSLVCLQEDEPFPAPVAGMLRQVQEEMERLDHPARFSGGGSTGYAGCGQQLLDLDFADAAAHYRAELPANGWRITDDSARTLRAERGTLVLRLREDRHGEVVIAVGPDATERRRILDAL